jgi:hypothetical protein
LSRWTCAKPCPSRRPNGRLGLRFAVAKAGDTRNAGVESAAPATLGGDSDPFANLATELDFAERQSIAIIRDCGMRLFLIWLVIFGPALSATIVVIWPTRR